MSRTLFDAPSVVRPSPPRPIGTLSLSIALHVAAIAVLAALQLTTGIPDLAALSPLTAYVVPPQPPALPATPTPRPPVAKTPAPATTVSTAPSVVAPSMIAPEGATTASLTAPPPSTAIGPGTSGDLNQLLGVSRHPSIESTPPPPRTPVRAGGLVRPPQRLVYVAPVYPVAARLARVEADVELDALIDETGVVRDVTVRHPNALFDRAAIEAVSQWRYAPTELNGQPVAVILRVVVRFGLR